MDVRFGNFALPHTKPDISKGNIGLNKNLPSINPFKQNSLAQDSFEKQNTHALSPSFSGKYDSDMAFLDLIGCIFETAVDAYYDAFYDEITTRTSINDFLDEMVSVSKQLSNLMPFDMDYIVDFMFDDAPDLTKAKKDLTKLLDEAKINNTLAMRRFLNVYAGASKKCPYISACGPEALKIYSKLKTKEDLQNFPELLLYLESESETSEEEINLDEYPDFIKKLGIKNENDFFATFAHLKDRFNNFDEAEDKVDAILYVKSTYDEKIEILKNIIPSNPELKNEKAEKLYLKATEIIDFVYDKNPAKADEKLNKILSLAIKEGKITSKTKTRIETFEDISTPEKRLEFLEFLSDENITIEELNELFRTDIISTDNDYEAMLINRGTIIENIADIKDLSIADAKKYYSKYREILNAAINLKADMYLPDGISAAINVIDKFNIKDNKDFANKYTEIFSPSKSAKKSCAKNKKQPQTQGSAKMNAEQAMEAIRILNFADEDLINKFTKNKKFPLLDELKLRKEEFEKSLPEIEEFLIANENPALSDKSPFEIFMDYKNLATNGEDIKAFLNNIEIFKTTDSSKYFQYSAIYNDFAQYFPDKKTTNAFLVKNGLKLDSSHESNVYRANCLKILNGLDKKKDDAYFEKLCQSDFIKNSKTELTTFLSKINTKADLNTIIKIILDKNVQSLDEIRKIIRLYADDDGKCDKVFEHFQNTPDNIGPKEYLAALDKIQTSFESYGIPIKINNDNISAIGNEYLQSECKLSSYKTAALAGKMFQNKNENIISSLEHAFADKKINASAYAIALEITRKANKNEESYQNILRELHLPAKEENLDDNNATRAEYVYAIAKALPKDFVDFVNDGEWLNFKNNGTYPNMRLHAKIRLIDRFALDEKGSIEKLHTKETQEKLKSALKTVYTESPSKFIKCQKDKDRFEAQFAYGTNGSINAVFSNTGEMITIVKH